MQTSHSTQPSPGPSPRIILASQSRGRLWLLESAGLDVIALPTGAFEPDLAGFADLETGLAHLAEIKARAAWRMTDDPAIAQRCAGAEWILAADTVTRVNGLLLGKPDDRPDAERMLNLLSGSTHDVLTGWKLLRRSDGLTLGSVECTRVTMREWTSAEKLSYLDGGEWQGRCGAYGLMEPDPYVTNVAGSASNVVGLPMERIKATWVEFRIIP